MKIVQVISVPATGHQYSQLIALADDGRMFSRTGTDTWWHEIPGPTAPEPAPDYKAQRDELAGLLRDVHRCEVMDPIPWDDRKSALIQRIESTLANLAFGMGAAAYMDDHQ